MAFLFSRTLRNLMFLYLLFVGAQYLLKAKSYTFSVKEFRSLAEKSKSEGVSAVNKIVSDLRRTFGAYIASDIDWFAFSAGGLQLNAQIIHASLTEFIVAFYAPFPTSGRSGVHFANATCTVLSGNIQRSSDSAHTPNGESFAPGANFRHGQFESAVYSLKEKTYVVCYGRGLIPVSSLWALTGAAANGDVMSAGRLLYYYGRGSLESAAFAAQSTFYYYQRKYLKSEL